MSHEGFWLTHDDPAYLREQIELIVSENALALTAATERIAALETENATLKMQLVEVRANLETERVIAKDWRDAYNRRALR